MAKRTHSWLLHCHATVSSFPVMLTPNPFQHSNIELNLHSSSIQTSPNSRFQVPSSPFASHSEGHASAQTTLPLSLSLSLSLSHKLLHTVSQIIVSTNSIWTSPRRNREEREWRKVSHTTDLYFDLWYNSSRLLHYILHYEPFSQPTKRWKVFFQDFSKKYIISPRPIQLTPCSATHHERFTTFQLL